VPHLLAIGGSNAGIAAALRARELDPSVEVTVALADAFPGKLDLRPALLPLSRRGKIVYRHR
jgi:NADPH-dependent 2,4-dienoyl-CoA reductase/sulfur reductase-like enzyme